LKGNEDAGYRITFSYMQEHRTIEQLENDYWKEVHFPSSLVEKCFAYRKIPVAELSTEQIRLLISQQIGLPYIVPKAITILEENILAEGDYYPGDLLHSLLSLSEDDWSQNLKEKNKLIELLRQNASVIDATGSRELIRKTKAFLS
jgi:hypothetical protein